MLETFKHPRVRDLAWSIGSPALLEPHQCAGPVVSYDYCLEALEEARPALEALENNPDPLLAYLNEYPSQRVGRYFEALTNYWLRNIANVEVVANNLQLREGKRTLGEIDFLFRSGESLVHWEAAVKFYLQRAPGCDDNEFIGPNTADNLASKLTRLFEKQLTRSTPEMLERALNQPCDTSKLNRQAFVKGWLFYGVHTDSAGSLPPSVSSTHLRGFWLRHSQSALPPGPQESRWALLAKPYWLAPKLSQTEDGLMTRDQIDMLLDSHFKSRKSPLLVAQLQRSSYGYQENLRGFVVPPSWPEPSPE